MHFIVILFCIASFVNYFEPTRMEGKAEYKHVNK